MCRTEKRHRELERKKLRELREFYSLEKRLSKETWGKLLKICYNKGNTVNKM